MVVWRSPAIAYWHASVGLRRSYLTPAARDLCICTLVELAQRSDKIAERAQEALLVLYRAEALGRRNRV